MSLFTLHRLNIITVLVAGLGPLCAVDCYRPRQQTGCPSSAATDPALPHGQIRFCEGTPTDLLGNPTKTVEDRLANPGSPGFERSHQCGESQVREISTQRIISRTLKFDCGRYTEGVECLGI